MKELKFQIKATELIEFQLLQPKVDFDINTIEFKIELEHKSDPSQGLLASLCSVTLMSKAGQVLGHTVVNCLYFVEDLKSISTQKKHEKDLKFLTDAINSISISTTRGFLAALTRGTFLHAAILPIVDPRQFEAKKLK